MDGEWAGLHRDLSNPSPRLGTRGSSLYHCLGVFSWISVYRSGSQFSSDLPCSKCLQITYFPPIFLDFFFQNVITRIVENCAIHLQTLALSVGFVMKLCCLAPGSRHLYAKSSNIHVYCCENCWHDTLCFPDCILPVDHATSNLKQVTFKLHCRIEVVT